MSLESPSDQSNNFSQDPDALLMLEFQKGDKASFETLMRKYYKRVLNFIYRLVNNRDIAEDLTQETFMRIYKSASKYSPQAKFQTWAFTIAKNLTLNELRRLNRKMVSIDETIEGKENQMAKQIADPKSESAHQSAVAQERVEIIKAAIESLPENQKLAVLLRRYEKLSYEEIAQTLDTSVSAVKSLLSRAKENLKEKLKGLVKYE